MVGIFSYGELLQHAYAQHKLEKKNERSKGILSCREKFGMFSGYFSRCMRELVKKTLSSETSIKDGFLERVLVGLPHINKISYFTHISGSVPTKEEIIGCIIYRNLSYDSEKKMKRQAILLCFIHPRYRNIGYGDMMVRAFIDKQSRKHKILSIVLHSVIQAEHFYTRLGFHRIQHNDFIERFETIEEDDIIMELIIT